jgi:DNA-binding NarL/FixJ family response regulator
VATRILLVEDHTIVREGLRALLAAHSDLEVVGECADGRSAVARAAELDPDVVLMDLSLPELDGVAATAAIVAARPQTRVLVLSMHGGAEHVRPAIRAGASGYLVKGAGLADLVAAVRAVARGEGFFSPQAAKALLTRTGDERPELTPREHQVLKLVVEGLSSAEIADALQVSAKTVEGYRSRLMEKLGAHNTATLVRHAIRLGLVPVE